jgi:hypothetical protein
MTNDQSNFGNAHVKIINERPIPGYNTPAVGLSYVDPMEQVKLPENAGWEITTTFLKAFQNTFTIRKFEKIDIGDPENLDGFYMAFYPLQEDVRRYAASGRESVNDSYYETWCTGFNMDRDDSRCQEDPKEVTESIAPLDRLQPIAVGKRWYKPLAWYAPRCGSDCSTPLEIVLNGHIEANDAIPLHYTEVGYLDLENTVVSASGTAGDSFGFGGSGAGSSLGSSLLKQLGFAIESGGSNILPINAGQGIQGLFFAMSEDEFPGAIPVDLGVLFDKEKAMDNVAKASKPIPAVVAIVPVTEAAPVVEAKQQPQRRSFVPDEPIQFVAVEPDCSKCIE